jgi:hypothetical protein
MCLRRNICFKEAMPTAAVACAQVLAIVGQLYGIERAASDRQLDAPARQHLRQEQARPILEKLHAYLQEQHATALPKSPLGTAAGYALHNWTALTRYNEDGRLKIDNNGAEQALRQVVLGRKNWLLLAVKPPRLRRKPDQAVAKNPTPLGDSLRTLALGGLGAPWR